MNLRENNRWVRKAQTIPWDDDGPGEASGQGGNSGTMIVEATCAPSQIRYPQDASLLNEARENAERLLDASMIQPTAGSPVPIANAPGKSI